MKGLGVRDGSLELSNNDGHGYTTIEALKKTNTFLHYVISKKHLDTLIKYVAEGDVVEENTYVLQLQEQYPEFHLCIENLDRGKICHCCGDAYKMLCDDPRMINSIECLKLSIKLKPTNPTEAIRVLSFGIHLIQDYFAHLNAPGKGDTGVSHGVNVLIDSDHDGIPDKFAGYFVDNMNWDCHSSNDSSLDYSDQTSNMFTESNWHYHSDRYSCWRFLAALFTTAEYMNSFSVDNSSLFEDTVSRGYVINGEVILFIDLLSRGV